MTDAPLLWSFDLSASRTGVCFGRVGAKPSFASIERREDDDLRRVTARLWVYMNDLRRIERPDAIIVEKPLTHGFEAQVDFDARTVKQRRGIIAAMTLKSLFDHVGTFAELISVPFYDVAPSTARKAFLGDGRLPRKAAKLRARAMCSVLSWPAENDDEADAGCAFHWGETKVAPQRATVIHPGLWMRAATLAANRAPAIFASLNDEVPW